jgi:Protein tyrosine and serine/threonine kinase
MATRRRRLDPVGPFGNPDGSRADIEDVISEFVDFGGDPAFGHLATRANDSMVRVIVGKLGAGKTVYMRRLQDFQAHQDSVYADVPQQSLPKTEVIVKACQWFSDRVLVEKWMQIWDRAIMRSLASHVLNRPELRQQLREEQIEEIERSYARLLDDFRRPRTIYSQVRDIINQRNTAHQLSTYLDDPLWDDLEDLLGEVVGRCKPIYFYLDALDEEFSHAPMYWLRCQEGLFYQVMRLLRDHRLGGRLHIVICIRDIVMSSVYRSEHAPRYYNEPHIRVLTWDRNSLLYLLQRKLARLPPSLLMRRAAEGPPTIGDWLGVEGHASWPDGWPGPDGDGTIEDYLLSHTRLIPRDIISLGNDLNEEVLRQKQAGEQGLPPAALQAALQRCAKRFGDSQLAQCANQISSDLMPEGAALHDYSELFTSTQAYISGVQEDVRSFVRMIGVDRFSRGDLMALQEVVDLHFEKPTNLASVLWQNGLLGYLDEDGRRRFYSMGDVEQFHFPPDVSTYVLHPCLAYAVGGIRHAGPDSASAGAGDTRSTRPLPYPDRDDLPGASGAALPGPDAAEVRSRAGARAADYAVGDVLDGRFEILQIVGQGSFSKVYRVRDDVEGEERALKLFDSPAGDEAVRREIGALRKIQHPNVVKVFWADKTDAGEWYLITEFIDGESLDEFVSGKRRLRDREAVDVALDLLDALVAFHPDAARLRELGARQGELSEAESREWTELNDKGLVHRDIKPLNVILTRTGAKLLDFNIASRVGDLVHTQSGTPPYQPPDASHDRWDVSTDLFAVGVLLYRLLCDGHHPFPNAMPMAGVPVTDPRTIRPDLNPDLAEFLIKACAPANIDRYATATDMQLALRNVRAGL